MGTMQSAVETHPLLPFEQGELLPPVRHPYLRRQLIAYIGNKRALLGFLRDLFLEIQKRHPVTVFVDPFAGSGSVSRLARLMGYRVRANDWEFYSRILNVCHLETEQRDLTGLFADKGGLDGVLEQLNTLPPPAAEDRYIAKFYAPRSTQQADYRRERLFYTTENASRIDAIRNRIEQWYPGFALERKPYREKAILLALLLYGAATHTNTSGVFKACHKGFGGHSGDALQRIMAPIVLRSPALIDARERAKVYQCDAERFAAGHTGDLCYLDPPYASHQYGSNYHLLNTIALWDKPQPSDERDGEGRFLEKAGIRKDWVRTRSEFCYRGRASEAFSSLLHAVDCRTVALSYNTEGIVPFEELYEMLAKQGRVTLYSSDYVKYRGGRQSLRRQTRNLELVLVLDRNSVNGVLDSSRMRRLLLTKKLGVLLKQSYYPEAVRERFSTWDDSWILWEGRGLRMPHLYRFSPDPLDASMVDEAFREAGSASLEALHDDLRACLCTDRRDEIGLQLDALRRIETESERRVVLKRVLWLLRKFAFKKYRDLFADAGRSVREAVAGDADLSAALDGLFELAQKRFEG